MYKVVVNAMVRKGAGFSSRFQLTCHLSLFHAIESLLRMQKQADRFSTPAIFPAKLTRIPKIHTHLHFRNTPSFF